MYVSREMLVVVSLSRPCVFADRREQLGIPVQQQYFWSEGDKDLAATLEELRKKRQNNAELCIEVKDSTEDRYVASAARLWTLGLSML